MTGDVRFPAEPIARLADLVLQGDVVFFVGAGFSLDSEGNFGWRLINRLLLRLTSLNVPGVGSTAGSPNCVETLRLTFPPKTAAAKLDPAAPFPFPEKYVDELAEKYFEVNDWFSTAFAELLRRATIDASTGAVRPKPQRDQLLIESATRAEDIRAQPGGARSQPVDAVPIVPGRNDPGRLIDLVDWLASVAPATTDAPPGRSFRDACRDAGKILFLETIGFDEPRIMGGDPHTAQWADLPASYGSRLLPRHRIIARLAREGLCTSTITTNFDLLLEGAFRLEGLHERRPRNPDSAGAGLFPTTTFEEFARITSPTEFFSEGKAHRTAVLLKMHGCTQTYRDLLRKNPQTTTISPSSFAPLTAYLPSVVFTYREIQNWRTDSWAAEYLRTLLRTRTVVLTGYSLQDPVIHDTFRSVYEEMAAKREAAHSTEAPSDTPSVPPSRPPGPADAPAFYLSLVSPSNLRPFHALEVLHAATAAVGLPRGAMDTHPNLIGFHARKGPSFPNLDEVFRWLFHLVVRLRQRECLHRELQRTIAALHRRARPDSETLRVRRHFDILFQSERRAASRWTTDSASRRRHARICEWTESFHPGLLREFSFVDLLRDRDRMGHGLASLRRFRWYYPTCQDGSWTCWGTLVELALRRMVHAAHRHASIPRSTRPESPWRDERIWAAAAGIPTVLFPPPDASLPGPASLSILLAGQDSEASKSETHGLPSTRCVWLLAPNDAPWRPTEWRGRDENSESGTAEIREAPASAIHRRSPGVAVRLAPPAYLIWRWASRTETAEDRMDAPLWLGFDRPDAPALTH